MVDGLQLAILISIAAVIVREDVRSLRIPNWTNATLVVTGLAFRFQGNWLSIVLPLANATAMFVGLFALCATLTRLRGRRALGLGDVKLVAASAVWMESADLPAYLLIASALALAFVVITTPLAGGTLADRRIPFGPFLCCGLISVWSLEHFSSQFFG